MIDQSTRKPLLVMLPFAGGNAYSYREIIKHFPSGFEVLCPELPGRGIYSNWNNNHCIDQLCRHVYRYFLENQNLDRPFAFFGHSMGALMVYQLALQLRQNGMPLPIHLIVSGREWPGIVREKCGTYALPAPEFREKLREMGGTPDEVLENEDLMDYFEPVLRADFRAVDNYVYQPADPLEIPVTVFYGDQEKITKETAHAWKKGTSKSIEVIRMTGDHFFIFRHPQRIAAYLSNLMLKNTENELCLSH